MTEQLVVHVIPGAKHDSVSRDSDGGLRIKVRTPPVDGRANDAVCQVLAKALGIRSRQIDIVAGQTSRTKRLTVSGLSADQLQVAIAALPQL